MTSDTPNRLADVSGLEGMIREGTLNKLVAFEQGLIQGGQNGLLDWLRNSSADGLHPLAKQIGIARGTLVRLYDIFQIPRPSAETVQRKLWKDRYNDPEFVRRHAEWSRKSMLQRWQDTEFREQMIETTKRMWDDPEFRERKATELRTRRQDADFNERMFSAILEARQRSEYRELVSQMKRAMWADPAFRETQLQKMQAMYTDPEWQRNHQEGIDASMEDMEWRQRRAEATREARRDPEKLRRYHVPSIQGSRRDIGYHAFSCWEANVARVLMYTERPFLVKEAFLLQVPNEYQELFPIGETEVTVDFVIMDLEDRIVVHDILAHPAEDPIGCTKLELLRTQYPTLDVRPITPKIYREMQKQFRTIIDNDPRFCGWETSEDNLRNNPSKFA